MKKALILCSGGLDSVVVSYLAKNKLSYDSIKILFFNYGQRNIDKEKICSKNCAEKLGADFIEIDLPWLESISTSQLNSNEKAKEVTKSDLKDTKEESEKWYVPCRNLIFLAHATALAESLFIKKNERYDILVGFKCEGSESYPDTTQDFVNQLNSLNKTSTEGKFNILAPLIEKDKEDIVKLGSDLNIDFKETFSCYSRGEIHCGYCLACQLRQQGFYWANIEDPTEYKIKK